MVPEANAEPSVWLRSSGAEAVAAAVSRTLEASVPSVKPISLTAVPSASTFMTAGQFAPAGSVANRRTSSTRAPEASESVVANRDAASEISASPLSMTPLLLASIVTLDRASLISRTNSAQVVLALVSLAPTDRTYSTPSCVKGAARFELSCPLVCTMLIAVPELVGTAVISSRRLLSRFRRVTSRSAVRSTVPPTELIASFRARFVSPIRSWTSALASVQALGTVTS